MKKDDWSAKQVELVYIEVKHLKEENARLHHLTNVLIQHIWKSGPNGLPLKDIDRQMAIYDASTYDDGGMDGTPRNR